MKILFAAAVPLALAGCAQPYAPPVATPLTRAADPSTSRAARPGPGVANTLRTIAEPEDWRRLNDAQAPGGSS
ncbi:hypothetical protein [Pseudooceanicola spongiae]|uniref:Uncharacterized protein n=1 Tax=Pseudooceanicola spongiae TaxID=2613965 RepID=A0A7L9WR63_9RHOB|nr:hypothetical protein [Pseudooceanicola spongiae]QOL82811.1 hypothetical protein F3W81_19460 [Pseudooceanicola spongiae]